MCRGRIYSTPFFPKKNTLRTTQSFHKINKWKTGNLHTTRIVMEKTQRQTSLFPGSWPLLKITYNYPLLILHQGTTPKVTRENKNKLPILKSNEVLYEILQTQSLNNFQGNLGKRFLTLILGREIRIKQTPLLARFLLTGCALMGVESMTSDSTDGNVSRYAIGFPLEVYYRVSDFEFCFALIWTYSSVKIDYQLCTRMSWKIKLPEIFIGC